MVNHEIPLVYLKLATVFFCLLFATHIIIYTKPESLKKLRLILGDQLNVEHRWFDQVDDEVTYCMFEMRQETDYVTHHIQKVLAFFLAMRAFADKLRDRGNRLIYLEVDHPKNLQDLGENIEMLIQRLGIEKFEYQLPDEYRLDQQLKEICGEINVPSEVFDTEHFLTERDEVKNYFSEREFLMERFYRHMRKKHNVLMQGDKPLGGRWNYDRENRKKIPDGVEIPSPNWFEREVGDLMEKIESAGIKTMGRLEDRTLRWPVTREEAITALDYFIDKLLPNFGKYQDAMTHRSPFLFHSRLSFALNVKLLHPLEVIRAVEQRMDGDEEDETNLAQVEGFIRQILGWREYMRGVYWAKVPEYFTKNYFEHTAPLPSWYWTGETKMECLHHAINQSLDHAYAHHIQRLMVTGNFALLAGCSPDEVDAWYLGIYIDAIEWVEITNTRGMSQYADGGLLATKPYISSANYINKMSDYCKNCKYDPKKKTGEDACPFNSLYWNFLMKHEKLLEKNHRMSMMYNLLNKMDEEERRELKNQAEKYLGIIDKL